MAISFNNVPDTVRTPGTYVEVDPSRALKGLAQNPHKALIIGQKIAAGTLPFDTLAAITRDNLAEGYFGEGSMTARMCEKFKENNPNTELYAMAIGSGMTALEASCMIDFSGAVVSADGYSGTAIFYLMINGVEVQHTLASTESAGSTVVHYVSLINENSALPVVAAQGAAAVSGTLILSAVCSGVQGNYIDVRMNYYEGQSTATKIFMAASLSSLHSVSMAGGTGGPTLGDAWAVIGGEQFHYVIQPFIDTANLTQIEGELEDRFLPLEDLQGHGFACVRASHASCTVIGNSRNSPHNTIVGMYDIPEAPEEMAAAWGAVAAQNLNVDPARPLHTLKLKGIKPPPVASRFIRSERDILLYDGIATFTVDSGGNVLIERSITTYQENSLGSLDSTYLDVQTVATLGEIRYQYKTRMYNRFIAPRFKLADDTFPVQPGSKVARPKDVKQESIALFTSLRDQGLIENLDDFIENIVVERDATDKNRINVLLPPNLVNQFRILAAQIQFIL